MENGICLVCDQKMMTGDHCRYCGQEQPVLFVIQAKIRGKWSTISATMDQQSWAEKSFKESVEQATDYEYRLLKFTAEIFDKVDMFKS